MDKTHQEYRRRRVRRLKRMIIFTILAAIVIPITICFLLLGKIRSLEKTIHKLEEAMAITETVEEADASDIQEEPSSVAWEEIEPEKVPIEDNKRKVYITFDDGPSAYTEDILDILDKYNVKATFFVTGEAAESHPERYVEIVKRGHSIGMHSYSHRYKDIYASKESFAADLNKLQTFLYDTTGVETNLYRFPGGSSNTVSDVDMKVFCDYLEEEGIVYFDWNVSSKDATNKRITADDIYHNTVDGLERFDNAVILMHDAVTKEETIEALPQIIEHILEMENTEILPITEDTVIVHHK